MVVRYKQTFLGILWALIRPLLNMAVFVLVFGKIAHLASETINYPLFVLAGMIPWQLFSGCLIDTSNSLVNNASMISKVYFPRVIFPASYIIVHCVDFFISLAMLFVLFLVMGEFHPWTLLALPFVILLALSLCLGVSLWLSAVTVRFRDFRFIVPFLVQFGVFLSPVGYSSFLIPSPWRMLYFLNPMVGVIESFRWCCFGLYHDDLFLAVAFSCLSTIILLVMGFCFFRKMERRFADII